MAAHRTQSHPEDKKKLVTSWHQTPSAVFLAVPGGRTFLRENGTITTEYRGSGTIVGQPGFAALQKMKYKQGFNPRKPAGFLYLITLINSH